VPRAVSATIRRNEDQAYDRFAHSRSPRFAALKDKIAGIQNARLAPAQAPRRRRT
jgi:hypothetical protein